jgi:Helicase HerA, central domain
MPQRQRLLLLLLYVAAFCALSRLAFGSWLPEGSSEGLWFYSGLAALMLGSFLTSPHFTKPADALPNAAAAAFAVVPVAVNPTGVIPGASVVRIVAVCLIVAVFVSAAIAMFWSGRTEDREARVSRAAWKVASVLGAPRLMFSVVFVYALWAFHSDSTWQVLVLSSGWVLLVAGSPLENLLEALSGLRAAFRARSGHKFGDLVGNKLPGLLLIRHSPDRRVFFGDILIVGSDDGRPEIGMALDHVGTAEGRWLRAALVRCEARESSHWAAELGLLPIEAGSVWNVGAKPNPQPPVEVIERQERLIGFVSENTDITTLRFEVVRIDHPLSEGDLVSSRIAGSRVLYQLLNGLTEEEIVHQKNTRGYVIAKARKLGVWNVSANRLEARGWLPAPNSDVWVERKAAALPSWNYVGHLPNTSYGISFDPSRAVTHSTAILGVLGSGKSLLACELIERMIHQGIKVVVLDLSNQYAAELSPFLHPPSDQVEEEQLKAAGQTNLTVSNINPYAGGSVGAFKRALKECFAAFLDAPQTRCVRVLNPSAYIVSRQDGKQFSGAAPMVFLTAPEITRLVAETLLDLCAARGMTQAGRCCLVLEEAHSLVPEFNAIVAEGDKAATNGTAKAILQGRKFGFGCLLITQRTANVTKSILNQCNTIFALQVFDATGMEFLRNYIGDEHSRTLSALEPRHAVAYGQSLSCSVPVILSLNDRERILQLSPLRQVAVAAQQDTALGVPPPEATQ